jgi:hypothetical protein
MTDTTPQDVIPLRNGPIRLACMFCDRADCDGLWEIPADWHEVMEAQTYEEACREVLPEENYYKNGVNYGPSVFDWYTHLGTCPECLQYGY